MKLQFTYSLEKLLVLDGNNNVIKSIGAFSRVRNERNHERPDTSRLPDIAYSENSDGSDGKPTMPRSFPLGTWNISGKARTTEKWLQPIKFITDATQKVAVWTLKEDGSYNRATTELIDDYGYRIHFANGSNHTDGCIGVNDIEDMLWLDANVPLPTTISVIA